MDLPVTFAPALPTSPRSASRSPFHSSARSQRRSRLVSAKQGCCRWKFVVSETLAHRARKGECQSLCGSMARPPFRSPGTPHGVPPSAHSRELYLSNDERAVAPLQQSERIRGAPIARRLDRAAAACWRSRGSPRMAGINPRRRNASPVTVVRGAKWHLVVVVHRGAAVDSNVEGLNQREERRNSCGIFLFATSLPSTCRTPKQPGFGSASFRLAIRRRASYGGRRAGHAMLGRGRRRSDRCASAFPL